MISLISISSISTTPTRRSFLSDIGGFTELTPGRGSKRLCGETSGFIQRAYVRLVKMIYS